MKAPHLGVVFGNFFPPVRLCNAFSEISHWGHFAGRKLAIASHFGVAFRGFFPPLANALQSPPVPNALQRLSHQRVKRGLSHGGRGGVGAPRFRRRETAVGPGVAPSVAGASAPNLSTP